MNRDKVVFIVQNYFDKRDYLRFGINNFLTKNIDVDVINIQEYTRPSSLNKQYQNYAYKHLYCYDNLSKIKNKILSYEKQNTVFISVLSYGLINEIKVINFLYKKGYVLGAFYLSPIPAYKYTEGFIKLNLRKPLREMIKSLIRRLLRVFYAKNIPFNFVLLSGEISRLKASIHFKKDYTLEFFAHSFDYDLYLKGDNEHSIVDGEYFVFIDQYIPYHPDAKVSGVNQVSPDIYYSKLNVFFNRLEKLFNIKVVIAVHPRSTNNATIWEGREYYEGNTSIIIKHSKACLIHTSTAISFCFLYNKPILFLSMEEMKNMTHEFYMKAFSKDIGKNILYVDKKLSNNEIKQEMNINNEIYAEYIKEYIKYKGDDKQIFDILIDNLEEKGFLKSVKR